MSAATTPVRDRLDARLASVETLLSLGLGREAGTVLAVALADAPTAGDDERIRLLQTMVAVLHPGVAAPAPMPASGTEARGGDDSVFWTALADQPGDKAMRQRDADQIRLNLNLLFGYPPLLSRAVSRRVAEALLDGGSKADLQAVAVMPDAPETDVARAVALDRLGHTAEALRELAAQERGADSVRSAEAMLQDVEIEVRKGSLEPHAAADRLAAHRLDWRLSGQDGQVLVEEARLRFSARQFAQGFARLQDAEQADPTVRQEASRLADEAIVRLGDPHDAAFIPDTDFISISDRYADLIRADPVVAAKVAAIRAEKLARLGLPGPAADAIGQALAAPASIPDRATLELRSAELRLEQGDADAAAQSLRAADADGLAPGLAGRRALVAARLLAKSGRSEEALAALANVKDPATLEVKADLLAQTGNWKGSEAALEALIQRVPAVGPLSPHDGSLVLRLATAAFRAGDIAGLRDLKRRDGGRFSGEADRAEFLRLTRLDDLLARNDAASDPRAASAAK